MIRDAVNSSDVGRGWQSIEQREQIIQFPSDYSP